MDSLNLFASILGIPLGLLIVILLVIIIWTVVWKGLALWRAAKNNSVAWFVVLLVVNTLGILEILYLFVFSKPKESKQKATKPKKRR